MAAGRVPHGWPCSRFEPWRLGSSRPISARRASPPTNQERFSCVSGGMSRAGPRTTWAAPTELLTPLRVRQLALPTGAAMARWRPEPSAPAPLLTRPRHATPTPGVHPSPPRSAPSLNAIRAAPRRGRSAQCYKSWASDSKREPGGLAASAPDVACGFVPGLTSHSPP